MKEFVVVPPTLLGEADVAIVVLERPDTPLTGGGRASIPRVTIVVEGQLPEPWEEFLGQFRTPHVTAAPRESERWRELTRPLRNDQEIVSGRQALNAGGLVTEPSPKVSALLLAVRDLRDEALLDRLNIWITHGTLREALEPPAIIHAAGLPQLSTLQFEHWYLGKQYALQSHFDELRMISRLDFSGREFFPPLGPPLANYRTIQSSKPFPFTEDQDLSARPLVAGLYRLGPAGMQVFQDDVHQAVPTWSTVALEPNASVRPLLEADVGDEKPLRFGDLENLIDDLSPHFDIPTPTEVLQARRNAEARALLLHEFGGLNSAQLAEYLGSEARNRASVAHRLRKECRIFGVTYKGTVWYPGFQFHDGRVISIIGDVLAEFQGAGFSEWEIALWFTTANGWLDDRRPVDLLIGEAQAVVDAARLEVTEFEG